MVNPNPASGKLLSFPTTAPSPSLPAENCGLQILETKEKLVSALEFLRIEFNAMLAGKPVKEADEILAQVEFILNEKIPAYTVVSAIKTHGAISTDARRKPLLLFPQVEAIP